MEAFGSERWIDFGGACRSLIRWANCVIIGIYEVIWDSLELASCLAFCGNGAR